MTVDPQLRLQNDLRFVKVMGNNIRLSFNSRIFASSLPSTLRITPLLYPEQNAQDAVQLMNNRKINTVNTIFLSKEFHGGFGINFAAGADADFQGMASSLAPSGTDAAPDSLSNDMDYRSLAARASIGLSYRYRSFHIGAGAALSYNDIFIQDNIRNSSRSLGKFFVNPNINMDVEITPNLKFLASGAVINTLGAPSSIYSGYIMTDYRVIGSRDGDIARGLYQRYSAELRYADALLSLFGSVQASYTRSRSNLMYGTEYIGSLSRIQTYSIDNVSQGWSIDGKIEKRFDAISTTIGIPVGFTRNWMDVLRQGEIMPVSTWSLPVGLELSSRLAPKIFLEYYIRYVRSASEILPTGPEAAETAEVLTPINAVHQRLRLSTTFFKRLSASITGEHYLNDAISGGSRNIFFLDASISYKARKFEYILEGRNLLGTGTYNQRTYSEITNFQYLYRLRPLSVMFKIRFSLG